MNLFKPKYDFKMNCLNCGSRTLVKIPKGTTIKEWIDSHSAKCEFCGCDLKGGNDDE